MREFTVQRDADTPDELWLLEHPPVYTLGLAPTRRTVRRRHGIPVSRSSAAAKITYHGPARSFSTRWWISARRGIKVKQFVAMLEQSVIDLLGGRARTKARRPGRLRRRRQGRGARHPRIARLRFHGLALNVDMDLAPFAAIDPCGYPGLRVTQTRDLGIPGCRNLSAQDFAQSLREARACVKPASRKRAR
jgi:lipoyl(octanoyl) transferase